MESESHSSQTKDGRHEGVDKKRIPVLFEEIVRQLDLALAEDGWASTQVDLAVYLDEVLLSLRHWNQDIKNHKENVLEKVEEESEDLAKTLRVCLQDIGADVEELHKFYSIGDQHRR
jgi:hypothetical protein